MFIEVNGEKKEISGYTGYYQKNGPLFVVKNGYVYSVHYSDHDERDSRSCKINIATGEYRYKANVEVQTILNNTLSENELSKCEIINIGEILSSDILENKKIDFYNKTMMSDDNIDNDRKNIFNEEILTKCNENMIIIATRKRYYAWCEVQKQTIEMLSIMIKQILLKYEA